MSKVTLCALPVLLALSACGGGSSSGGLDSPPDISDVQGEAEKANDGILRNYPVTLMDGSRLYLQAQVPTASNGQVASYLLEGQRDSGNRIVKIVKADTAGPQYAPATAPAGEFTYSGRNVAYLRKGGGDYGLFEGTSDLTLDFGKGSGSFQSTTTLNGQSGGARADLDGTVRLNPSTGGFGTTAGNPLDLTYTDRGASSKDKAGLVGSLHGNNAGFSAVYEALGTAGVSGTGVTTGRRN